MQEAANYLIGEHDFLSFCSSKIQVASTVRIVYDLKVEKKDEVVTIRIKGNGFLYNMVRIISGALIRVGLNMLEPYEVKKILDAKVRTNACPNAPARGLTLIEIEYKD
jgi:tRNA pseudouridine38-40 synthase